jgi:hypothetical protein
MKSQTNFLIILFVLAPSCVIGDQCIRLDQCDIFSGLWEHINVSWNTLWVLKFSYVGILTLLDATLTLDATQRYSTLLWRYSDATLTLLWRYSDATLTLLWRYSDATLTLLWRYSDATRTLPSTLLARRCTVKITWHYPLIFASNANSVELLYALPGMFFCTVVHGGFFHGLYLCMLWALWCQEVDFKMAILLLLGLDLAKKSTSSHLVLLHLFMTLLLLWPSKSLLQYIK